MRHVPPILPPQLPAGSQSTPVREATPSLGTGARIWLCRHAQVHSNFATLAYGDRDVPLSPEGLAQTAALWEAFAKEPIGHVHASPLQRAKMLGEGVAERTGAKFTVDPRLREISRGDWTMLERSEFQERWSAQAAEYHADTYTWNGYSGESDEDIYERVFPAFKEALVNAQGGTAFLAVHFNVVRVLLSRLLGVVPEESFLLPIQTAHASLLIDERDGWKLAAENVSGPTTPVS